MMLGAILNPINTSIIAVALVPIGTAFGAPASQTAWLISALYVATAIGQPLAGRLVDTFGPKRLFLAGACLTGIAGVVGALAPDLWVLVGARVILGFGTCAGYPAAMYLIRSEADRTGMKSPAGILTILAVTTQTVAVIGPTLGGILVDVGGWRSTLAINVPLGLASLALGWIFLPASSGSEPGGLRRIDWPGVVLFAGALVALLLFLMHPRVPLLWLFALAVAAAVGFARRELRCADPFIDVRVFAGNVPLLATYARSLVAYTVSYAFIYGYTQWLEDGRGLSASVAGLILLPTFGIAIVVSTLTGRRAEVKGKLVIGAAIQLIACSLLFAVDGHAPIWLLVAVTATLGVPQGLISLAIQNALYHQAHPERMGASSGLLRTFAYLGAISASTAAGFFFGERATTAGLHHLALFMLGAAAIFFVITVVDRSLARIGPEPVSA